MGPPRSRCREGALPASFHAPRLRRCDPFTRSTGTSRHVLLQRSRNRLPRDEIPPCRIHSQILEARTNPAASRFLLCAIRGGFSRHATRPRKAHCLVHIKFTLEAAVQGVSCPPWPSNSLEQLSHTIFAALRPGV